ncbi:hypothetical protein GA0115256_127850 [Streptomyces sp. DconLS]|nr:hypothetical protein GA0115256_127850 [Streptomyces sp. DconLS]
MVRTPPPLPVRDKAAARALSPMLNRLAEERATGVLVREHGTLHLAEGRVVHAESPLAPGLDVLLTAHGTLATAAWQRAAAAAEGPLRAAELLLESGLLPAGALELCHLDALYDAGYFALAPSSTPGRFHYDGAPRTGTLPSVPVVALERETLRRRLQLHRLWPEPAADTAPLIRADPLLRDTGPAPSAPARPARRTPVAPASAPSWTAWTAPVRPPTSPGSWAGRRSTRWSTCAGWRRPGTSDPWRRSCPSPRCRPRPHRSRPGTFPAAAPGHRPRHRAAEEAQGCAGGPLNGHAPPRGES